MAQLAYPSEGRPKNVALQERRIAELQKQLDRLAKIQADTIRQMELETQRLGQMQEEAAGFMQGTPSTTPALTHSTLDAFQSQYDRFRSPSTAKKVSTSPITSGPSVPTFNPQYGDSNKRIEPTTGGTIPSEGKIEPERPNVPYAGVDGRTHWEELSTPPRDPVYVSGYYFSSGEGTKEYEYLLWPGAFPIRVGDMVSAPVHPVGYHQGKKTAPGHDRRFIVTSIYSQEKFQPYHDLIR